MPSLDASLNPQQLSRCRQSPQAGNQEAQALTQWKTKTSITEQWPETQETAESAQHPHILSFLPSLSDHQPTISQTPCQPGLYNPVV